MRANASMRFLDASVGKKIAMAVSGLLIVGWLFMHMVGNLLIFAGPEALDAYGEFIQHGTHGAVWVMRAGLLGAIVVHVVSVVLLIKQARVARPVAYQGGRVDQYTNTAARAMRYGGVALLLYIVYHLMHMTIGVHTVHPTFEYGRVYHNMVSAFVFPSVVSIYLIALLFLGLHLFHGVWSALQTLGLHNPRWEASKRWLAAGVALVICGGFALPPLAVFFGFVS